MVDVAAFAASAPGHDHVGLQRDELRRERRERRVCPHPPRVGRMQYCGPPSSRGRAAPGREGRRDHQERSSLERWPRRVRLVSPRRRLAGVSRTSRRPGLL